ncbi:MAG TPA: gamma-glutamyl-gamma-aminobutyrate hydrolase family protein [Vineibacter sp.]|nr:gamma-glutamyl-gamma-aminobutyrate hydrolase family protein [Vineibacter sp.]
MSRVSRPMIGVSACRRTMGPFTAHAVGEKYILAITDVIGGVPLVLPAVGDGDSGLDIDRVLDVLDGMILTGSPSNVAPAHYGGPPARRGVAADPARDITTLPLIRRALDLAVPLFAICRGFQELNVALGGTLHQHVEEVPGRMDHRSPKVDDMELKQGPAHSVNVMAGGQLHGLLGCTELMVNSLHGQGIDRLAPRLKVEAVAPDGQIEAVSVPDAPGFVCAVQWHPEYRARENPLSMRLFDAFSAACRARAASRVAAVVMRAAAE